MAAPLLSDAPKAFVPPLQNGDRLSREEFERRWDLHPEIKKAELIDGQVFLEMTVSRKHGRPHSFGLHWASTFALRDPSLEVLDNVTVRLDENDLQPDVLIRKLHGGSSRASIDDCVDGPPEFVMEIAASSATHDLNAKKRAYERGGVLEYVVWQQYENRLDWFVLVNGRYEAVEAGPDGIIESRTFAGLRLNVPALLSGDLASVVAAVTPASA